MSDEQPSQTFEEILRNLQASPDNVVVRYDPFRDVLEVCLDSHAVFYTAQTENGQVDVFRALTDDRVVGVEVFGVSKLIASEGDKWRKQS